MSRLDGVPGSTGLRSAMVRAAARRLSGSALARSQSAWYWARLPIFAFDANSAGGGKTRLSLRKLLIDPPPVSAVMMESSASWIAVDEER